ncbi:MAG: flagellar filament capping protein FliD [Spirochaetes bacterium]|nr:flagellar filament capping protein FliD [Spirochaetota bacterium]
MPVTMSGLASDIDTEGLIHKLVEVEKIPLQRLHKEKEQKLIEQKAWTSLKEELLKLDDISRELYGYRSIFREKEIIENEAFNLIPTRVAKKGQHKIEVMSLASSHKVLSDPVKIDEKLPGSVFIIKVGDETRTVKGFQNGGTLNDLVEAIQKEAGDLVDAETIKTDSEHAALSLESKKSGEKNRLNLQGEKTQDERLFQTLGLFSTPSETSFAMDFNDSQPSYFEFLTKGYNNTVSALIRKDKKQEYLFPGVLKGVKDGNFEIMYNISTPVPEAAQETGKEIKKNLGNVKIKDVIVHGIDYILNKFLQKKEEREEETFNAPSIELLNQTGESQSIKLEKVQDWTSLSRSLEIDDLVKMLIHNPSSMDLALDNIKIVSLKREKDFKNVIQPAGDAEIKVDGITLKRDKNEDLDDVIDGSILNLKGKTDKPVTVQIKENSEKIHKLVNQFIDQYNKIINFVSDASKTSESTKPGEHKEEDRGVLSNDIALMNLQSKLRSTVVSAYDTSFGNKLSILGQIGITTGRWGSVWDKIRKGTLEINKEKFLASMDQFGERVGELFGYDSDNDKKIDTGVAFKIVEVLRPFTITRGMIDGKINMTKVMIENTEKSMAKKEKEIENYQDTLKRKFGKMESSLQQLKGMQQQLDNALGNLDMGKSKEKEKE